jgi:hypothetical protein
MKEGATMIRTNAREGITGLVQALRGRWSSSHRWHGRIELCIIEGCDGSFGTPAVIDLAWRRLSPGRAAARPA